MKGLLILLLALSANAERVSRTGSSSDCRSVKVLAIGGELQPNTWGDCSGAKESHGINSDWYKNKVKSEREEYRRKQDGERAKRKHESDDRKHEAKHKDPAEDHGGKKPSDGKAKDCHGVGAAADCTGANPGHAAKEVKGKGKKSK